MTQVMTDLKVIQFVKEVPTIGFVRYNKGEIAGFPAGQADILIREGYAVLHGDGRPQKVGARIPDAPESGNWAGSAIASHIAALKQR